MSLPHHRRYRLLQGTRHCPVKRALLALALLAALLVALLYLYEWHREREEAIEVAQADMVRAMIERDEVVYLVTFGAPQEPIEVNWQGEKL